SVNNSNYPITRPLHLTTHGKPTGNVKKFIDWTLSPEGQAVIKKYFISVSTNNKLESEYTAPMIEQH
ncbi:MAG: hypothetical protein R8K21_01295, partial [Mariprofundales bacterium]